MSIDKIDQYIRGLYANESVPPPPGAEDALFERMAKNRTRSRFGKISGSIALLCFAYWFGAPLMEQSNVIQSIDDRSSSDHSEAAAAEDAPQHSKFVPAGEALSLPAGDEQEPDNVETNLAVPEFQESKLAVSIKVEQTIELTDRGEGHQQTITTMESLPVASIEKSRNHKELLETEGETWVMPAVVRVKD